MIGYNISGKGIADKRVKRREERLLMKKCNGRSAVKTPHAGEEGKGAGPCGTREKKG